MRRIMTLVPKYLALICFALAALIPIFCYSGQKTTKNTWIQRGFYLFYPVHLMILLCISQFA